MTVLIVGATGLLGRATLAGLRAAGIDAVGTGHSRAQPRGLLALDARDPTAVAELFADLRPDVIINATGERRPENWTDEILHEYNVALPQTVARACAHSGAWLIHISSDYVFDGSRAPYRPDSPRHPINPYGRSKAQGEDAVRAAAADTTMLRLPVLFGPVEGPEESNLTSLIPLVTSGQPAAVDDWAIRYPTLTTDVGAVLAGMTAHAAILRGQICHWSATEALTKYEMARRIGEMLELPTDHLVPDRQPSENRPRDPLLDCARLEGLGVGERTPLSTSMPRILSSLVAA